MQDIHREVAKNMYEHGHLNSKNLKELRERHNLVTKRLNHLTEDICDLSIKKLELRKELKLLRKSMRKKAQERERLVERIKSINACLSFEETISQNVVVENKKDKSSTAESYGNTD